VKSSKASSLPTIFSRNVRNQQNNTACYLARRISKPLLFVALGNALTVRRQESRLTDLQKEVTNADNHEYFAEKIRSFLIVLLLSSKRQRMDTFRPSYDHSSDSFPSESHHWIVRMSISNPDPILVISL
jgi:hypothetical protein